MSSKEESCKCLMNGIFEDIQSEFNAFYLILLQVEAPSVVLQTSPGAGTSLSSRAASLLMKSHCEGNSFIMLTFALLLSCNGLALPSRRPQNEPRCSFHDSHLHTARDNPSCAFLIFHLLLSNCSAEVDPQFQRQKGTCPR